MLDRCKQTEITKFTNIFDSDHTMVLSKPEQVCDEVLKTLKISRLVFSLQEIPYSAYITIRKKFSQKLENEPKVGNLDTSSTIETLKDENTLLKSRLADSDALSKSLTMEKEKLAKELESTKIECAKKVDEWITAECKITEEMGKLRNQY